MKIRNGFVSNSSTSSFILIGFKVKKEEREFFENYSSANFEITYLEEKGEYYFGMYNGLGEEGIQVNSIEYITDSISKVHSLLDQLNIKREIKFLCGNRYT